MRSVLIYATDRSMTKNIWKYLDHVHRKFERDNREALDKSYRDLMIHGHSVMKFSVGGVEHIHHSSLQPFFGRESYAKGGAE